MKETSPFYPVRMHPAFRSGRLTPWGGERLRTVYGKAITEVPTGESLEVSCIQGLESTDDNGEKLTDLIARKTLQAHMHISRSHCCSSSLMLRRACPFRFIRTMRMQDETKAEN